MRYIKISGYVLLAALSVSITPYVAEAASVKISPRQFKASNTGNPYGYQSPSQVAGDEGEADFSAVVKLPVGKRITELVLCHGSDDGNATICVLNRVRWGESFEQLATLATNQDTDDAVVRVSTTDISPRRVQSGYTYYVAVRVEDGNRVHGVKVKCE